METRHSPEGTPKEGLTTLPLWRRFHLRATLAFAMLALVLVGAMGWLSYGWAREAERSALEGRLRALAVAVAARIDADVVAEILAAEGEGESAPHAALFARFRSIAAADGEVSAIYVVAPGAEEGYTRFVVDWDDDGMPVPIGRRYDVRAVPDLVAAFEGPRVEREITRDEWGRTLSGYAPIRDASGRAVAVVGVDVRAAEVEDLETRVGLVISLVYGACLLLLVIVGLALGRSVRRPIARLVEVSEALSNDAFDVRVGAGRRDELGRLGEHFDRMADALVERERVRSTFGRFVSEEVARRALASPDAERLGGEALDVTVLFIDLRGSSALLESLAPSEVVALLERYLDTMSEAIEAHGGCVLEMLGDAILAVFGAPERLDAHPSIALLAALDMLARLDTLSAALREEQSSSVELRARIGLHTGRVVAGNIGGATRLKYGVIGDTVNIAARVEALNETLGTELLATAEVYERLPLELAGRGEAMGAHRVKGRAGLVDVYAFGNDRGVGSSA